LILKKNIITITILLCTLLFNTACDKKNVDHQTAIIEMDGDITYILKEDTDEFKKNILEKNFKYNNTDVVADTNVYDFLIVLPIKSKTNIYEFIKLGGYGGEFYLYTTDSKRGWHYSSNIINVDKDIDNYYHYEVLQFSNGMASEYFLNDIRDLKMHFIYKISNYTDDIEYRTNELIIPKEQLINLLDSLAIPHDRLDFQTD